MMIRFCKLQVKVVGFLITLVQDMLESLHVAQTAALLVIQLAESNDTPKEVQE